MATEDMAAKLAMLKNMADELVSGMGLAPTGTTEVALARRFDCGDYTCHGHFTCSSFGCGNQFRLAD